MIITIINKILIITFILSILNIIRHGYYFIQAWLVADTDNPINYKLNNIKLLFLGLSIAYVLSTIFTGLNL